MGDSDHTFPNNPTHQDGVVLAGFNVVGFLCFLSLMIDVFDAIFSPEWHKSYPVPHFYYNTAPVDIPCDQKNMDATADQTITGKGGIATSDLITTMVVAVAGRTVIHSSGGEAFHGSR